MFSKEIYEKIKRDKDLLRKYTPDCISVVGVGTILVSSKMNEKILSSLEASYKLSEAALEDYKKRVFKKNHPIKYFFKELKNRFRK